jgi:hypothetical protein
MLFEYARIGVFQEKHAEGAMNFFIKTSALAKAFHEEKGTKAMRTQWTMPAVDDAQAILIFGDRALLEFHE